ncbi:MAG: hypothetical protein GTN59_16280, partial [Candidatus Dadabacteria bacterium]|nr:hypothetical protein [Candidatus Dadabacteria bacterium]
MGWFKYIGGYISKIKQRNSDDFISMSNAAGVDEVENGLFMLGIVFDFHEKFSIGAINYTVDDVINIFYSESHFTHILENGIGIR